MKIATLAFASVIAIGSLSSAQGRPDIEPELKVLGERHYQETLPLNCAGLTCTVDFPPVAANWRLLVRLVSCDLRAVSFGRGTLEVRVPAGPVFTQYLAPVFSGGQDTGHIINQATDVWLRPQRLARISLDSAFPPLSANCALIGTLQRIAVP